MNCLFVIICQLSPLLAVNRHLIFFPDYLPDTCINRILGNINTNSSLTNLMLQSGMTRDQLSMLAASGLPSSASLANLLLKQRSFDQQFNSMQSFEDLASMLQAGMPNNQPKAQMKNMDWGFQGVGGAASTTAGIGNMMNPGLMSFAAGGGLQQPNANASAISSGLMNINNNQVAEAAKYGTFLQNATTLQGNNIAGGGQVGGGLTTTNDINSYIQSLAAPQKSQQQQVSGVNYGNLLQGIGGNSILQNDSQNSVRGNSFLNLINQSVASLGNMAQPQSYRPLMQNLQNDQFAVAASQGNPMMMALAQQQLLAQAGTISFS
jgi:hypothetical protein